MPTPDSVKQGLPPRMFLYTPDQLCVILQVSEQDLHARFLYHVGRDVGYRTADEMTARNIAPQGDKPDWRVSEEELIRWMKRKGFKFYDRSTRMK